MNLYQLEQEQNQLADLVLESGDITDEQNQILAQWIEETETSLGEKIDKYLNLSVECEGLDEIGKIEAAKIAKRRKAASALRDRLRGILLAYFERNFITGKISTPQGRRVGVENCAPALEIDENQVPVEYYDIVLVVPWSLKASKELSSQADLHGGGVTLVPDKEKIKADMKAGKEIPGCTYKGGKRLAVR